ncbi:synembryn-A-like [Sinocyclocheilus grahami]|uniref:synembryn-A-like n=1 Tax=Sinocyclocheilus grahami TaxID=75366 RepID=UPI0007ACD821|nr:PREDICTED: synembryn-A-like [Sinocyclocheilus grahami]
MKMDLNAIIEKMETGDQDAALTALQTFNKEKSQCFSFNSGEEEDRERLGELVLGFLERDLQPSCQLACLETIRILSRDKKSLAPFATRHAMQILIRHAGLGQGDFNLLTCEHVCGCACLCVLQEEAATYRHLGAILRHCIMSTSEGEERTEEMHSHTVNLLGNLPLLCLDVLLMPKVQQGSIEYMGVNMDAVKVLVEFMEKILDRGNKLKETLLPSLNLLTESARIHRETRKFLRIKVLPPLRDVKNRPEVGHALRNKLVRLMTHIDTDVKHCAAEFLFVLCKESVSRFIKYTGYGNAAGLLAARGLMRGGRDPGHYSEDEDSDTEEYREAKPNINPVTGRVEEEQPNPMEGMTEEQKEYEAMKLVNMFDKLSREQLIQPMKIGADGKMTSLEPQELHYLASQQFGESNNSDSDSDTN